MEGFNFREELVLKLLSQTTQILQYELDDIVFTNCEIPLNQQLDDQLKHKMAQYEQSKY